jgi:hypothetical protein
LEYYRQGATSEAEDGLDILSLNSSFELDSASGRFESGTLDMRFSYKKDGSDTMWILSGSARYI